MEVTKEIKQKLFDTASAVYKNAYAGYSGYSVGAALLTSDGEIFSGCNVENASFGLTVCAERIAIFQAVAKGKQEFPAILILTKDDEPASPCGACRQVMCEFMKDDAVIFLANHSGIKKELKFSEVHPYPFRLKKKF